MQETLLAELSTTRRVPLHGQIGEALGARYGERADERASRLAQHFVESATLTQGHAARVARYSRMAAEQAEAQFAWGEAARLYEQCLSLVTEAPDRLGEDEAELLVAAATCYIHAADPRAGLRHTTHARDIYRDRGDPTGFARATLIPLTIGVELDPEQWRAPIDEALSLLNDGDPHLRAELLFRRAGRGLFGDEEGVRAAHEASELAKRHNFADMRPASLTSSRIAPGLSCGSTMHSLRRERRTRPTKAWGTTAP